MCNVVLFDYRGISSRVMLLHILRHRKIKKDTNTDDVLKCKISSKEQIVFVLLLAKPSKFKSL